MRRRLSRLSVILAIGALLISGLAAGAFFIWKHRVSLDESRVKLVDDFNDGTPANLIGGEHLIHASVGAQIEDVLERIETPTKGDRCLAVSYELAPGSYGVWGTGLNELDISAAESLRFWLKTDSPELPDFSVKITDGFGTSAEQEVRLKRAYNWRRIDLPLKLFERVNFNRLTMVEFRLSTTAIPLKGTLYLDDLGFAGKPFVFFESLRDNLYGFPSDAFVGTKALLGMPSSERLRAIAKDTWGYFRDLVDRRHNLPINYVQLIPYPHIGDYASPTDIGMYLMSVVSAYDFGFIEETEAIDRIKGTINQLDRLPKWRNLFYNYYSTTNLQITDRYVSSVDNAWLAVSLVVVRQAFPSIKRLADRLFRHMDFSDFYDPQVGQMRLGYESEQARFAPYHYGILSTEARIISIIAIGKGDVPEENWFRIYRTPPTDWDWQSQLPKGAYKRYKGHDVFQGYYTYEESDGVVKFVPSWGGSLFEFLMPTIVVDEKHVAPRSFGANDKRAIDIHIDYALNELKIPVWGLSSCATPNDQYGGYTEFGVPVLGVKGYRADTIITPHVTMLALPFEPDAANKNIEEFLRRFKMYGPYGLYDSVDAKTGDVAYRYLAIDKGMSLVALDNYLNNGAIQHRFNRDRIMRKIEGLLRDEVFFESGAKMRAN